MTSRSSRSKPEGKNPFEYGPYIQNAVFCDRVLRESDGVLSLIRIVDVITHSEGGTEPPEEMPKFRYPLTMVLTLKAGTSKGRHEVSIEPELPSGEKAGAMTVTVQMEGEGRGTNIIAPLDIEYSMEGLYWFNVKFDGVVLTRMPLQVRYSRVVGTSATPGPQPG